MIPTVEEIEVALARLFDIQKHLCLPTTTMFFEHEIDFLAVRQSGYAVEVEIKRSVFDMKAEKKKTHNHESNKIVEVYYCFPKDIIDQCFLLVPKEAGVLQVKSNGVGGWKVTCIRSPVRNKNARKLTEKEINKILRYSNYRVWGFKRKIVKLQKQKVHEQRKNNKQRKTTKNR